MSPTFISISLIWHKHFSLRTTSPSLSFLTTMAPLFLDSLGSQEPSIRVMDVSRPSSLLAFSPEETPSQTHGSRDSGKETHFIHPFLTRIEYQRDPVQNYPIFLIKYGRQALGSKSEIWVWRTGALRSFRDGVRTDCAECPTSLLMLIVISSPVWTISSCLLFISNSKARNRRKLDCWQVGIYCRLQPLFSWIRIRQNSLIV